MAFDTSPAAAPSRPRRIAAALLCAVLFGAAPAARAAEQVYIWRDANGAVRFSPVGQGDARGDASGQDSATSVARDDRPTVADGR